MTALLSRWIAAGQLKANQCTRGFYTVVLVSFCAGTGVVVHVTFVILVSVCVEQYSYMASVPLLPLAARYST